MTACVSILFLLVGMAILIVGAEALVRGASALAKRLRISDLAIGLTVVAFGTSAPELSVNILASLDQKSDIVFGNVVGSNICNILLILGIAGIIRPLIVQRSTTWKEIPLALAASILLVALMVIIVFPGEMFIGLSRMEGAVLLVCFGGFMFYVWRMMLRDRANDSDERTPSVGIPSSILMVFVGLAALVGGGKLTVNQAVELARLMGVDERLIALTIVAIGTSLPELATSAVAAWKGNADIAVGNVVGSNLFNILFIFGTSVLISPVPPIMGQTIDLTVMTVAVALLFLFMFTGKAHKLDRWESVLFLAGYIGYVAFLFCQ
jgi:cation:H+ antiporter